MVHGFVWALLEICSTSPGLVSLFIIFQATMTSTPHENYFEGFNDLFILDCSSLILVWLCLANNISKLNMYMRCIGFDMTVPYYSAIILCEIKRALQTQCLQGITECLYCLSAKWLETFIQN